MDTLKEIAIMAISGLIIITITVPLIVLIDKYIRYIINAMN